MLNSQNISKPFEVYSPSQLIYVQLSSKLKSHPLSQLGSPRQTEPLYNYQPHHHHLTVVNDLIGAGIYVGGEQTTLNEVYIAYLNQVNVGAIEMVYSKAFISYISEY